MTAGDAGLDLQALASDYGADGRPRRMSVSVETWQAQQAVVDAARERLASADAAWLELGLTAEDTPELALQLDPNGHWAALRTALIALDKAQAAQPEGEQAR